EDGIRDRNVTGVQTCALPIFLGVEKYAYRSQEWQEFLSYNTDRSTIMDYYGLKNYEDNQEFYESLDLSPEEVENLQRYSLYLCEDRKSVVQGKRVGLGWGGCH